MSINIDPLFSLNNAGLISSANNIASAVFLDQQRQWMLPPLFSGSPLNVAVIGDSFSRDGLSETYQLIFTPGVNGSVGDSMACRVQADYLSAQERAFRLRHCSFVRGTIHAATRRAGHGSLSGVIQNVETYVQNLIALGGA